jgi:hypothetical protein
VEADHKKASWSRHPQTLKTGFEGFEGREECHKRRGRRDRDCGPPAKPRSSLVLQAIPGMQRIAAMAASVCPTTSGNIAREAVAKQTVPGLDSRRARLVPVRGRSNSCRGSTYGAELCSKIRDHRYRPLAAGASASGILTKRTRVCLMGSSVSGSISSPVAKSRQVIGPP